MQNRRVNIRGKNFLLTFPQNEATKEHLMEKIKEHLAADLDYCIVAAESHKSGDPHLHAFIASKKRIRLYHEDLDKWTGKHGNYLVARSKLSSVKYCMKGDNYIAHGFEPKEWVAERDKKRNPKNLLVAKKIQQGTTVKQLIMDQDLAGFTLLNLRKIKDYKACVDEILEERDLKDFFVTPTNPLTQPEDAKIELWLTKNINVKRKFNQKQLWIHGNTCMGKSTLLVNLGRMLKTYIFDNSNQYVDGLDDTYDLCIFDEYKGQKTIQFMNQFLDGSPMRINQKNGYYLKKKNFPVIVCSNYSIANSYPKVASEDPLKLATIKRRFIEVNVQTPIDLYKGIDWDNLIYPSDEEPDEPEEEDSEEEQSEEEEEEEEEEEDEEEDSSEPLPPTQPIKKRKRNDSPVPLRRTRPFIISSLKGIKDTNTLNALIREKSKNK